MKILVLSDSHSALRFMRYCIDMHRPDAVVHLGDHYDDALALQELYPHIRFHMVPGNCDRFRCSSDLPMLLCYDIGGVRVYMTHGHLQYVKSGDYRLVAQAQEYDAKIALYGHTHTPVCYQTEQGMWVMNPGTCGTFGGSAGIVEVEDNEITSCRIWRQEA